MQESREATPWKQITLFLLTLGVLILCALILRPSSPPSSEPSSSPSSPSAPTTGSPPRIKNRSTCAAVALILVVLAVIVPTFFLAQELGKQAFTTVNAFRDGAHQEKITDFIANRPALAARIEDFTNSIDVNNAARGTAAYLGGNLAGFLGNSVRIITQLVVMLFLLFFLLRDRALALTSLRSLLPLRDDETTELLDTSRRHHPRHRARPTHHRRRSRRPRRPRLLGPRSSRRHPLGLHPRRLRHDPGLRLLPRLGTRRDLPRPHRTLGQSRPPRHLGRPHRQHHRQHPLPHPRRLPSARPHRHHPALHPRRHRSLRPHRHRPRPRPLHHRHHPPRHLAHPHLTPTLAA